MVNYKIKLKLKGSCLNQEDKVAFTPKQCKFFGL